MNRTHILLAMALCLLSFHTQAQWQWVDKDGRKVFSDRAPGPEVPERNILKQPGRPAAVLPVADATTGEAPTNAAVASAPAAPEAAKPQLTTVDKELIENKKKAEAAEAAKVKAEQDQVAKLKSDNCERATASKKLLDSGVRVSLTTNAKGEREVLDDSGRAAELKRIAAVIDANCR